MAMPEGTAKFREETSCRTAQAPCCTAQSKDFALRCKRKIVDNRARLSGARSCDRLAASIWAEPAIRRVRSDEYEAGPIGGVASLA